MYEEKVRKFKCYYCPDCKLYAGSETKIVHGRRMKPNTKYCTGGKKIIIFRSDDPKVNVPKWCPKRRVPPTLRIYHFRSPGIEAGERMLAANGISFFPYPSRYAVRYEGDSPYTAMEFAKQIKNHSLAELLSIPKILGRLQRHFTMRPNLPKSRKRECRAAPLGLLPKLWCSIARKYWSLSLLSCCCRVWFCSCFPVRFLAH